MQETRCFARAWVGHIETRRLDGQTRSRGLGSLIPRPSSIQARRRARPIEMAFPSPTKDQRSPSDKAEVVVVSGVSASVGRATVRAFARGGASIGLLAPGQDRVETERREVEDAGSRVLAIPADVAHPTPVENAASKVEENLWLHRYFG